MPKPTSMKFSISEIHALCEHYLQHLYNSNQPHPEQIDTNKISQTHGEILYSSIDKILKHILINENDIFVDFGSGLGKVTTQIFLKTPIKKAYGIEIIPEFHRQAIKVAQQIRNDLPSLYSHDRELTFLLGDFLQINLTSVTLAFINAVCFDQQTLLALGKIINRLPSIHTILTLRPIATLQRLTFRKSLQIECSWDTALCYLYQ